MSVVETNKIDGIAKGSNEGELFFLITDHLDWENEYEHLIILQDKINAYLSFIESEQYMEIYANDTFKNFVIEIHFKNKISENCKKFLKVVSDQVVDFNIQIQIEMS